MRQLYSSSGNGIRLAINGSGLFEAVFKVSERNKIIKTSMTTAGEKLVTNFWAKRFTKYVTRSPFRYPKKPMKLGARKLRGVTGNQDLQSGELSRIWSGIRNREFFGWDPWGNMPIPQPLINKWMKDHNGQYETAKGRTNIRRDERLRAYADLRRWAKKRTYEYVANLIQDEFILPLVDSGVLRKSALQNTSVKSISTQKRTRCTIATPRMGRQNQLAIRILGTLPSWEFDAFVRYLKDALGENIAAAAKNQKPRKPTRKRPAVAPRKAA